MPLPFLSSLILLHMSVSFNLLVFPFSTTVFLFFYFSSFASNQLPSALSVLPSLLCSLTSPSSSFILSLYFFVYSYFFPFISFFSFHLFPIDFYQFFLSFPSIAYEPKLQLLILFCPSSSILFLCLPFLLLLCSIISDLFFTISLLRCFHSFSSTTSVFPFTAFFFFSYYPCY